VVRWSKKGPRSKRGRGWRGERPGGIYCASDQEKSAPKPGVLEQRAGTAVGCCCRLRSGGVRWCAVECCVVCRGQPICPLLIAGCQVGTEQDVSRRRRAGISRLQVVIVIILGRAWLAAFLKKLSMQPPQFCFFRRSSSFLFFPPPGSRSCAALCCNVPECRRSGCQLSDAQSLRAGLLESGVDSNPAAVLAGFVAR
jgi:hypothetical protein